MRAGIDKGIVKRRCLQINFGCVCIQKTLQLLPECIVYPMVYSSIRLLTLSMNSRTGSKSGCISSDVVT